MRKYIFAINNEHHHASQIFIHAMMLPFIYCITYRVSNNDENQKNEYHTSQIFVRAMILPFIYYVTYCVSNSDENHASLSYIYCVFKHRSYTRHEHNDQASQIYKQQVIAFQIAHHTANRSDNKNKETF